MRSHYKRIGDYVTLVKLKNSDGAISSLKGININKHFMPSVANVNGTDLSTYRVVKKNQFAFNPMHVGRDEVLPISMLEDDEPIIVSPAYVVFEVKDEEELLPAYLMMWCRRSEFDRNAWFMTDNSVRGGFSWTDFCDMELPIPSIEKQREIVREYNVVNDRIALNEQLTQKLEDTAQALYKQWFVDFEFPISKEYAESIGKPELEGKPYKSSGGEMSYIESMGIEAPTCWLIEPLSQLVVEKTPITYGVVKPGPVDSLNGVPFIRSGDIKNGYIETSELRTITQEVSNQYKRTLLSGGELLIALVGNPGAVALVPEALKGANIARQVGLIKIGDRALSIYVKHYISSFSGKDALNDIIGGSVQQVINLDSLRQLNILIPDSSTLDNYFSLVDSSELFFSNIQSMIDALQNLREVLLTQLVRG
ncbi:type I restriction enzyme S subunit [Vibrio diazotrophicus]|uniref:Type I restriction enzyme S subunit n=1 Tax=Vibrio diazotrophicus TaxID=685 RepID=A0A329EBX3_VIBDI|nr:restriction endonuclease subunit S [Vibrio diazotrophicus]RAS64473.1 type I restriction enzyme S subunit [Vibrio diazotrophicus]